MNVLKIATLSLAAALALGPGHAFGQQQEEKDHVVVLEFGAAGEWGLGDGKTSFGPSVAVEVTPIEHWLEIEAGVAPLMSKGSTEWDFDLVFKKPFQLSKNVQPAALAVLKASRCEATKPCTVIGSLPVSSRIILSSPAKMPF